MNYTYTIVPKSKTITLITKGELNPNEVAELELKIRLIANDLKYKIIFDFRLSKIKISVSEAFYWMSNHFDNVETKFKQMKSAYLVNKEDWEFYTFFEYTNTNNGFPIKAFREEALISSWLES